MGRSPVANWVRVVGAPTPRTSSLRRTERASARVPSRSHRRNVWTRLVLLSGLAAMASCEADPTDRWLYRPEDATCTPGAHRCAPELERCVKIEGEPAWSKLEDCTAQGLVCSVALSACATCVPGQGQCQ